MKEFLNQLIPDSLIQKNALWANLTNETFVLSVYRFYQKTNQSILIVTPTLYEANQIYDSLVNVTRSVYLFPMDEFLTSEAIAISPELKINRLDTLNQLLDQSPKIVITHLMGYLRYLPDLSCYKDHIINLKKNATYSHDDLLAKLYQLGYHRESMVTQTGEYAVRGYILDVFPLDVDHPIRIEFFDDEIESIRYFDEETQKSLSLLDEVMIKPYTEYLLDQGEPTEILSQKYLKQNSNHVSSIVDYLNHPVTILKDEPRLMEQYRHLMEEVLTYKTNTDTEYSKDYFHAFEDIFIQDVIYYTSIDNVSKNNMSLI